MTTSAFTPEEFVLLPVDKQVKLLLESVDPSTDPRRQEALSSDLSHLFDLDVEVCFEVQEILASLDVEASGDQAAGLRSVLATSKYLHPTLHVVLVEAGEDWVLGRSDLTEEAVARLAELVREGVLPWSDLARCHSLPEALQFEIALSERYAAKEDLASNPVVTLEVQKVLAEQDTATAHVLLDRSDLSSEVLDVLVEHTSLGVREGALAHPNLSEASALKVVECPTTTILFRALARTSPYPNVLQAVFDRVKDDPPGIVHTHLVDNAALPATVAEALVDASDGIFVPDLLHHPVHAARVARWAVDLGLHPVDWYVAVSKHCPSDVLKTIVERGHEGSVRAYANPNLVWEDWMLASMVSKSYTREQLSSYCTAAEVDVESFGALLPSWESDLDSLVEACLLTLR